MGTLGEATYVVRGMATMPGRKCAVLFSDGLPLGTPDGPRNLPAPPGTRIWEAFSKLTQEANRAGIVLYTVDTTAQEAGFGALPPYPAGLALLAAETGGLLLRRANLNESLAAVLQDQAGYYLIGYPPKPGTVSGGRLHRISVRVKRRGLRVRARSGFSSAADEPRAPALTRDQQLIEALQSPFASNGVRMRLTPLFQYHGSPLIRAVVHLNTSELEFTAEPDGWRKAEIDTVLAAFAENASLAGQTNRHFEIRLRGKSYEQALANGVVYTLAYLVKTPGAFQLRVAVRDTATGRTGSASQFIDVPDLAKGRLALSGLVLRESGPSPAGPVVVDDAAAGGADPPAIRLFPPRQPLLVSYDVFNARQDRLGRVDVEAQLHLFREGKEIWEGRPVPLAAVPEHPQQMPGMGRLDSALAPGEYELLLTVSDKVAGERRGRAMQWADFEIAVK